MDQLCALFEHSSGLVSPRLRVQARYSFVVVQAMAREMTKALSRDWAIPFEAGCASAGLHRQRQNSDVGRQHSRHLGIVDVQVDSPRIRESPSRKIAPELPPLILPL